MRAPIQFHQGLLPRVADFDCGAAAWEREISEWIKAPLEADGALRSMANYGTSVWLYETAAGDLIGYASLGESRWTFNSAGRSEKRSVQIIPCFGLQKAYQGKPDGVPRGDRYSRRILADVLAEASARVAGRKAAPILGLYVHPENHRAVAVYEQSGFHRLGANKDGYIRMFVNISPPDTNWSMPNSADAPTPAV